MKVAVITGKTFSVEWKYNDKATLSSATCIITDEEDKMVIGKSNNGDSINELRLSSMTNALSMLFPNPLPTAEIRNSRGALVCMDYTQEELQTLGQRKEIRRAFYKAYLGRAPKVTKRKLRRALKSMCSEKQIQMLFDIINQPEEVATEA